MDPRSQGLLLAAIITFSLAVDTALRSQRTRRHFLFMLFAANLGAWQLTSFFARTFDETLWHRVSLLTGVLLPHIGLRFFHVFQGEDVHSDRKTLKITAALGVIAGALAVSPWHENLVIRAIVLAHTAGLLYLATYLLHRRARKSESRAEATKVKYIVWGNVIAITFSVLDFLPALGIAFQPIGTFLTLIVMYVLSQSLHRHRLFDIYELIGRLAVLTAMGMTLAAMFTGLVYWSELSGQFFLNAVVAALLILILFDPLRSKVEEKIADFILRERWEFERQIAATRADLWHVFDVGQIGRVLMAGFDRTRRATHAALFIISDDGQRFERINSIGADIPERVELAAIRPLLDRLEQDGVLSMDHLTRELESHLEEGQEQLETATTVVMETANLLQADVVLPISTEEVTLGLITLRDERLTDEPYTTDDISSLKPLATQVGVAVQNSQYYAKMKERDRLAALGEMAAGLAHEIRNPLGAIKGAAELLEDERNAAEDEKDLDDEEVTSIEFLDVIVEETNRLNRVVSTFLDYARPYQGEPELLEINEIIERTVQIENAARNHEVEIELRLSDALPEVNADPERLHQVFINLVRNAVQAMERKGTLIITTRERPSRRVRDQRRVEVRFSDTGPGISDVAKEKIFIPFFTTKQEGTGLGLPICQRIVQDMGGSIEVDNTAEVGTTFIVTLPASEEIDTEALITTTGPFPLKPL